MNRWVVLVLAFLGCVIAGAAAAQDTGGTLAGRTVDAQGLPLPGVAVTATGAQGAKTAVSDADGRFTVPFLTPGSYAVHVELQGFAPIDRTDVQVRLGQRIDLPLTLQCRVAAGNDSRSSRRHRRSTRRAPRSVPASTAPRCRACRSAAASATRCTSRRASARAARSARRTRRSADSSGLENQYVVDGVNITNGGYGALGSYSIVFGSLGNGTPYDFMQEVQVKTGGYEAEFGQATGGVINVVTKSGSNALRGSAFGYCAAVGLESTLRHGEDRRRHREHDRIAAERRRRHGWRTDPAPTVCSSSARSIRSGRRPRSSRPTDFPLQLAGRRRP